MVETGGQAASPKRLISKTFSARLHHYVRIIHSALVKLLSVCSALERVCENSLINV